MFSKEQRGTFKYWWAHWCAYQLTALNLGCWKFRFLFHDMEKPFLKILFRNDYSKVQAWHRHFAKHHITYWTNRGLSDKAFIKLDILGMVIDWECSRLTKSDAQMNARETLKYMEQHLQTISCSTETSPYPVFINETQLQRFKSTVSLTMDQLGL